MANKFQFYRLEKSNTHLLDILNKSYFLETGVIDPEIINEILNNQVVNLKDIIYKEIAVDGTGKITNLSKTTIDEELYFQLNYLKLLRRKSSSDKLFITCSTVKYYNLDNYETFAPIVLIPVSINYKDCSVKLSGTALPNTVLINYLYNNNKIEGFTLDNLDKLQHTTFNSCEEIDLFISSLTKRMNLTYTLSNYITSASIEYVDYINTFNFSNMDSIYSVKPSNIYYDYFNKCNCILPSNIYQKYIINNYKENKSFIVNGKLGSGKTSTIINIISNELFKKHKILYVNQDIDNIKELQNKLYSLGLNKFIYSYVSSNKFESDKRSLNVEYNKHYKNEITKYNNLETYYPSFNTEYHGFLGSDVYSEYAYLNKVLDNKKDCEIAVTLESFEVKQIINILNNIKDNLKNVGILNNNIYHNLLVEHNDDIEDDVKEIVDDLNKINNLLKERLTSFSNTYDFKYPNNYRYITYLYESIASFNKVLPVESWKNYENRLYAFGALREIENYQNELNILNNELHSYVSSEYQVSDMEKYLKDISGTYFNPIYDVEKLNKLAIDIKEIKRLNSSIISNINSYNNIINKILSIFGLFEYDDTLTSFIYKISSFLNDYKLSKKWFLESNNNYYNFIEKANLVSNLNYHNLLIMKEISPYIIKKDYLEFENIDFKTIVLDYKKIRKDRKDNLEIDRKYHEYSNNLHKIYELIYDKNMNESLSYELKSYLGYVDFSKQLENTDYKWLRLLIDYLDNIKVEQVTYIVNQLNDFISIYNKSLELKKEIYEYIPTYINDNYSILINQFNEISTYFNNVIDVYNKLYYLFTNKEYLNIESFNKVIEIDNKIIELKNSFKSNVRKYKQLLGTSFNYFDTNILKTRELIKRFEYLINNINNDKINYLLSNINECYNEINVINNIYDNFNKTIHSLSTLFKGGLGNALLMDINEISDFIFELLDNYSKLPNIIKVLQDINLLKKFKLDYIINEIEIGNVKDIDKLFYYNVLKGYEIYFNNLDKDYDNSKYIDNINEIYNYEANLNNYNLSELYKLDCGINKFKEEAKYLPYGLYLISLDKFNYLDVSDYDIVLIDDAHLGSSNKYGAINKSNRVIIFGDKSFNPSISNSLMNVLSQSYFINLSNRYISLKDSFRNEYNINNTYIYNPNVNYHYVESNNHKDIIELVLSKVKETNKTIKIIYKNNSTKLNLYKRFVNILLDTYTFSDTKSILKKIEFVNSNNNGISYSDYIFIEGSDYLDIDELELQYLAYKYSCVSKELYYISYKSNKLVKNILKIKPEYISNNKLMDLLILKLKEKGLTVKYTYGLISIIIESIKPIGLLIFGCNYEYISLINEFIYYYNEYKLNNYDIIITNVKELSSNFDDIINKILERIK